MTRAELQNDPGIRPGSERALDIRISRLRQKLNDSPKAPKLLRTIYGAGYIFTSDVAWAAMLSAFSTRTAENLNSGIFPNGSIAGFVRIFAAAST